MEKNENIAETIIKNVPLAAIEKINGRYAYAVLPANSKIQSLELYNDAPATADSSVSFNDISGFMRYVKEFKNVTTRIFACEREFTCLIDYHQPDKPCWTNHLAKLNLRRSANWRNWVESNNFSMTQRNFANFLIENIDDITSPNGLDILSIIKSIRLIKSSENIINIDNNGAETTIEYKTSSNVASTQSIAIPEQFEIAIPTYVGAENLIDYTHFKLVADLHVEYKDGSEINFRYKIRNLDHAEYQTFSDLVAKMEIETDVVIYKGAGMLKACIKS